MIVRKRRGRRTLRCLAGLMACSFLSIPRMPGNKNISLKRLRGIRRNAIQDSDHQPNYNDILAERIQSTQNTVGPVLSWRMKPRLMRPAVSVWAGIFRFPDV